MASVIATTEPGKILDSERRTAEIYQLGGALGRRWTARLASGDGEIHVDRYPAATPGGGTHKGVIVFVHGLSGHSLMYGAALEALSRRGFEVAAIDVRGHGRSSGPSGHFTVSGVVEDLRTAVAWMRAEHGGPLALVGSSMGGFWALAGAGAIDDVDACVSHWVMLPDMPVTKLDRRMRPVARVMSRLAPNMMRSTRTIANWDAVCDDPRLVQRMYDDPMMTWDYSMRALASFIDYRPVRPLEDLRVPQLVIIGEQDGMTPLDYTRRVMARLRGPLDSHVVPNAGHMGGFSEHRDEVLAVIDMWLTSKFARLPATRIRARVAAGR